MERLRAAHLTAVIILGIGFALRLSTTASGQSLSADLAFNFTCEGNARLAPDSRIERFLSAEGFRVLNVAQGRYALGVPNFWDLEIVGIDSRRRWVVFMGLPRKHGSYSAVLYTPPPTHHDKALEEKLLAFVHNGLQCTERQVERHDNGQDAVPIFDKLFKNQEAGFREAEQLLGSRSLQENPSDEMIRRGLIGAWTVPHDSSDYNGATALEQFRADGTYTTYLFADKFCGAVRRRIKVSWKVENGILISTTPNGIVMRDEVVSIGKYRMVLHSLEDGTSYVRERSSDCTI